jgi:hypothetical protein
MDLFPPALRPDAFQSSRIRIAMVEGDNMEPTLRGRRDYVACAPIDHYDGEGLYLVDLHNCGIGTVYRCQGNGSLGGIWLLSDNRTYSRHTLSRDEFDQLVLAKVVADIKLRDEATLRTLAPALPVQNAA